MEIGKRVKSVAEYLDEVDYSFDGYVPSKEALMFVNFIQEVNGGSEENETPLVHLKMMDTVFNRDRKAALMIFRGAGKTSLFAEYLILFIAAFGYLPGFGKVELMIYVSDSVENGVKNLRRNVEFRFENSEFLQKLIPNKKMSVGTNGTGFVDLDEYDTQIKAGRKFTDVRLEFTNYRGDSLVVKSYGAATGVRGVKEKGQRPVLAILDDIISDTDATSPTIISTIENTVYKAVSKALHPTRQKMIWLGTPFNENDPLYKAVSSGAWKSSVFPIAERFDSKTTKEDFRGAWEDRFPYEYVKQEFDDSIKLGRPQDFYQELMLRINSDEQRLIPEGNIVWYSIDDVIHNLYDYNIYITTDAAVSESKRADYSVISVWAVNNNLDILLIDGWHDKVKLSDFINKLFWFVNKYQKYNLMGVGIEISAQQKGFISMIQQQMLRDNVYFTLLSNSDEPGLKVSGTNKFQRFLQIQPKFALHKIWFPKEMKDDPFMVEMLSEIRGVAKTNPNPRKIGGALHDDCLDTISQLGMFDIIAPSVGSIVNENREDEGIWYTDTEEYIEDDPYSF